MKIGLVQSVHSAMYNFRDSHFPFSQAECQEMQRLQVAQNEELLHQAAGQGFDLLVTTECINYIRTTNKNRPQDAALYPPLSDPQVQELGGAAKAAGSWLVAGFGFQEGETARNAALVFDRSGTLHTIYEKIHLAGDEAQVFRAGNEFCTVDADFGRFGVCICWDMQFPETARILALRGANLIVCPTWGWEAGLYGRARAYENGIFTAAAMAVPAWGPLEPPRTPSAVVAPDGAGVVCARPDRAQLVSCEIDLPAANPTREKRLLGRRAGLYKAIYNAARGAAP